MTDITFLFTDIEGSTRLWEAEPARMRTALARHDALARAAVEAHRGAVVKTTGDGLHAVFDDALDALAAALRMQLEMAEAEATGGLALPLRCGLHLGPAERRDGDYYGSTVNRAARLMAAAHGGQVLASQAVAQSAEPRLPAECALRDLGPLRLRDLAEPERAFQLVHPKLRREFPALRALAVAPSNLPHPIATFVGRGREMALLREELDRSRLVTLAGMGGIGKTRLAIRVAAEAKDRWPDGAWIVELAPVTQPERVARQVASVLALKDTTGEDATNALCNHLRERSMLILLDNCEHVLEGAAECARRIVEAAPGVTLIATSREPLQIPGEVVLPLTALPVPGPRAAIEVDGALRYDAVQLFVQRARAGVPDFELDDGNVAEVSSICHRLDGIPLAIELAAARVRSLPVAQIAARLKDRFKLLSSGGAVTARQRTLQGLMDWSHDLLTPPERQLLRELSVFAGGWTLEAAERVCGAEADDDPVMDRLARMVEKSLVTLDPWRERYGMLETVRQYAAQRLDEAPDPAAVRSRHAAHFAQAAVAARAALDGAHPERALKAFGDDHDNFQEALAWLRREGGDLPAALGLAGNLKIYWIYRGYLDLALRETRALVERLPAGDRTMLRCRALYELGHTLAFMGRHAQAREALGEALDIARALDDPRAIRSVLQPFGTAASALGEHELARRCFEECIALFEAAGDPRRLAGALNALGQLLRLQGALPEAEAHYQRALLLSKSIPDMPSVAIEHLNLASLRVLQGRADEAKGHVATAMGASEALASRHIRHAVIEAAVGIASATGDLEATACLAGAAEAESRATGLRRSPADEAYLGPLLAAARTGLGDEAWTRAFDAGFALEGAQALERVKALLGISPSR